MPGWMNDFINDLFLTSPMFRISAVFWQWCMDLCTGLAGRTPEDFSSETWSYVTETLYPWALGIGTSCMNLFFLIGFLKAVSNFHEQMTLELCIEAMIRLVALNVLMLSGLDLIRAFFRMAAGLAGGVLTFSPPGMYTTDVDLGARMFWMMFGFGYFLVTVVCGIMILLTLYGRYLKLYLLVVFYPVAMPALVGGRGVEQTAYAWIRSFLSNVFEIVVIALTLSIAGHLIQGITLPEWESDLAGMWDGAYQSMNSMIQMILLTASVKGASSFLKQSFGL